MNELALELTRIYIESKKNTSSTKKEVLNTFFYFKENLIPKAIIKACSSDIGGSKLVDLASIKPIKK